MFDQKPTPGGTNQSTRPVEPPTNLPIGGQDQSTKEPEDILADVDGLQPPAIGPSQPNNLEPLLPATPVKPKTESREPFFKRYQKIIVIFLIILVAVAVLAVGSWYAFGMFFAVEPASTINSNQLDFGLDAGLVNQPINVNSDLINQPDDFIPDQGADNVVPTPVLVDTDLDGLTDEEEAIYGTDINKVDTDEDGLTDRDETKVFRTDPNNPDTDGDGYTDGDEVRAGYDPKGPGRLLEIE